MAILKPIGRKVYGLVLLPVLLGLGGYLILSWVDGQWWGVVLWVVSAPLLYLAIDFWLLREADVEAASARRKHRIVVEPRKRPAAPRSATPASPPGWDSARRKSAGGEILSRGRRYDRR